ncbi:MAG: rod shape-determining protein MreC [Clostridia bacterium]|nr:rod shape-determining protein MreC [Clostridia bacterium]
MNFFRDHKNKIFLSLATVIFVVVMISSAAGKPNAGMVSDTVGVVLKPFQSVGTYFVNCFRYGEDAETFEAENTRLKKELITANKKAADYDALAKENAKLRSMLELKESSTEFEMKAASVIGTDTQNWTSVLQLDKGLSDGIKKNDAVITESGLVGYVSSVGRNWAKVVTVIDVSSSVGAKVDRIDEYCVVKGDADLYSRGFCSMNYVTTQSKISVGDILTTSGEGGVFPKGIIIGKINDISSNTNGLSLDATVEPAVDFSSVSEVFVIIN